MRPVSSLRKGDYASLGDPKQLREAVRSLTAAADVLSLTGEPMSAHTSLLVGGPAALYLYPRSADGLVSVVQWLSEQEFFCFVIGYGTNLLVSDDGIDGVVIDLKKTAIQAVIQDDVVSVDAGVWMGDAIADVAEAGLGGWGKLAGIPGGLGGLIAMNAGAFRSSISDYLTDVTVMDYRGNCSIMSKADVGFGYRTAPGLQDKIVLSAKFQLPQIPVKDAQAEVEATIKERRKRNVMTLPSAGSVFKNPTDHFAAKLIESVGGKGMREGGVEVSPLHANFIVNAYGGNATDIVRLISRIRELVYQKYKLELMLEVRLLGFKGETDMTCHLCHSSEGGNPDHKIERGI